MLLEKQTKLIGRYFLQEEFRASLPKYKQMMMPQQMQMPPMPAGLSMANFMPRIFIFFFHPPSNFEKLLSSFNGWFTIHGPPPGFPPMPFNGSRF